MRHFNTRTTSADSKPVVPNLFLAAYHLTPGRVPLDTWPRASRTTISRKSYTHLVKSRFIHAKTAYQEGSITRGFLMRRLQLLFFH